MARSREFDVDQAVERAMELFWGRGYAATSLQDLTAELGIGSGSLYAAFGSKEQLYARALGRYCSAYAGALIAELESAPDVRSALRAALIAMVEADVHDPSRGCFLVNAVTERPADPATADRATATLRLVEGTIAGALERAQARGDLPGDKDTAGLARFLTTFVQGLRVMGKARADRVFLDSAVSHALSVLD